MINLSISLVVLVISINQLNCSPSIITQEKIEVIKYLQSFGYLPRTENITKISRKQLQHALKRLQINGHIEVTQTINENVLKLIRTPRCGVHDDIRSHKRQKRYDLLGDKWHKHHITWRFEHKNGRYYHEVSKIRRIISEALHVWQKNSVLRFEEVAEEADIVVSFEKIYHPEVDRYPMNDPVLAHAFRPGSGVGGDVHFREDLNWNFDVMFGEQPLGNQKSFFAIALHELGHSLGLGHSEHRDAVMYMYYTKTTGLLSVDDISGIHHIYGVPRKRELFATTQTPSLDTDYDDASLQIPDKCDTSYDAIAMIRNELFIFKGRYMWRPSSNSDAIEIRKMWTELPESLTHVDAVFENDDSKIWFFVDYEVYVFSGTTFEYRSTLAHLGIDHHFRKIDAIFKWHSNKLTYVFSGDQYWRLNGDRVDEHYPKDILRAWRDVYDIDTAFSKDEKLYFFKGKSFYEFNHRSMRLNRMNPQPVAQNFMKCPGQKQLFKLATRFGDDENVDVIDDEEIEVPEDDGENPEKPLLQHDNVVTPENTSDDASKHQLTLFIMLASLAISRVLSSISLYL